MARRWPTVAVVSVVVVGLAAPVTAPAEPSKKAIKKAKRHDKKGKKLYKKKKFEDAIVAFDLAYNTAPQPRHLYNIGMCHEQLGDLFTAMEFIQRFVDETTDPAEKEDAQAVADILRGKLQRTSGQLEVTVKPAGAVVHLKGVRELTGKAPMAAWLEAGTWQLQVAKDGYDAQNMEVVIATGETAKRSLRLESLAAKELRQAEEEERAADAKEAKAEAAKAAERRKADEQAAATAAAEEARRRAVADAGKPGLAALAAWGIGGALLVAGGAFALLASTADADLTAMKSEVHPKSAIKDQHETASVRQTVAVALTGAAVVAAGGGVALWLLQDPGAPTTASAGPAGLIWTF